MNYGDLQNPSAYVYIRVVTALSNKFKEGDYVKMSSLDYRYEDDDDDEGKMGWAPTSYPLFSYRSRFDWNKSKDVSYEPIFQITKAYDGYIEVKLIKPTVPKEIDQHSSYYMNHEFDVTGHSLRETVDNYLDEMDMSGVDLDHVVEAFLKHYVRIDDNYSDSLIFETEYVPYSSKEMDEKIEEAKRLKDLQDQESVRLTERALKGHATRRRKRAEFLKQSAKVSKPKRVVRKTTKKRR